MATDNKFNQICATLNANLLVSRYSCETMNYVGYAFNDEIVCIDLYNLYTDLAANYEECSDGYYYANEIKALTTMHWYMTKAQLQDYEGLDSYNLVKLAMDIAHDAELLRFCIDTANAKVRLLS